MDKRMPPPDAEFWHDGQGAHFSNERVHNQPLARIVLIGLFVLIASILVFCGLTIAYSHDASDKQNAWWLLSNTLTAGIGALVGFISGRNS